MPGLFRPAVQSGSKVPMTKGPGRPMLPVGRSMLKRDRRLLRHPLVSQRSRRVFGALVAVSLLPVVVGQILLPMVRAGTNPVIALDTFNRSISNGWGTADLG